MESNTCDIELLFELFEPDFEKGSLTTKTSVGGRPEGTVIKANKKLNRYVNIQINGSNYRLHRILWAMAKREWPSLSIDHIDGNRWNNKLTNLRLATTALQNRNQRNQKGYNWDSKNNAWRVATSYEKKYIHVDYFDDEEIASTVAQAVRKVMNKIGELDSIRINNEMKNVA